LRTKDHGVFYDEDELEKIWKEMVMTELRYYTGICMEGLRKTTKTLGITGILARNGTEDSPNTSIIV
jgi:hypothetical protein